MTSRPRQYDIVTVMNAAAGAVPERNAAAVSPRIRTTRAAPESPTLPGLKPGTVINEQYQLIRELGRGGMGAVYLARDIRLGRQVAVKFLSRDHEQLAQRFMIEARLTARCRHENIVAVFHVGQIRAAHGDERPDDRLHGRSFMALEYIEGETLRTAMNRHKCEGGPLSPARAVELMLPVVRALVHAHQLGIVHRDLKPDNIMLPTDGPIKVVDFGIAKLLADEAISVVTGDRDPFSDDPSVTRPEALLGTVPYMSPEQLSGGDIDGRSDLWAVGVILYELVTGCHPLEPFSQVQFMDVTDLDQSMPRASDRYPELGPLGALIDRCLLKRKLDRTSSARVLLAELERLVPGREATRARPAFAVPFVGMTAYQESDAERLCGREHDIADLMVRLRTQPLLTIAGASGSGMSSLVRAGLVPALKNSGESWTVHVLRPGRSPLRALVATLQQLGASAPASASASDVARDAQQHERLLTTVRSHPGYFGMQVRAHARATVRNVLLVVDPVHEMYAAEIGADERAAFVACLEGAADDPASPVRVVCAMDREYVERVHEDRAIMPRLARSVVPVPPLTRAGLRDALSRPVRALDFQFESTSNHGDDDSLVADMLDVVEPCPGLLAILQLTAARLWERRDAERRLLTRAAYDHMGGLLGVLAAHADAVLAGLSGRERTLARDILTELVTSARTPTRARLSELRALTDEPLAAERVVHHLVEGRILVLADAQVALVHASLIDRWAILGHWLDARTDPLVAQPVEQQARERDTGPGARPRARPPQPARTRLVLAVLLAMLIGLFGYLLGHSVGARAPAGASAARAVDDDYVRGQRAVLMRQLELRFGPLAAADKARIEGAPRATVERWSERVLTRRSTAEVLAAP